MIDRYIRLLRDMELEEKVLHTGVIICFFGLLLPWIGGQWYGSAQQWNGFGFYYSFYPVKMSSFFANAAVTQNTAGFDVNSSALTFGSVAIGGTSTRSISINNSYPFPVKVKVKAQGTISDKISAIAPFKKPEIYFFTKERIAVSENFDFKFFVMQMGKALKKVCTNVVHSGNSIPGDVHVFLHSPWCAHQNRNISFVKNTNFEFTQGFARELIKRELTRTGRGGIFNVSCPRTRTLVLARRLNENLNM
jgi:hypothetical protein